MNDDLTKEKWLPQNKDSYKGIFIVGKNNRGKTIFLNKYSTDENFIDIKKLETMFLYSYRETFNKNSWFNYSVKNLSSISALISPNIQLEYNEPITNQETSLMTVFSNFRIAEEDSEFSPLSSTGYMSLFLIASYLSFYEKHFNTFNFCFFDEIDMYLDISNKTLLINILVKILKKTKFVISTHSPFTIVQTKDFLVYNIETEELSYTNDIGNLEGVIKKMIKTYNSEYILSDNFEKLRKIYKDLLITNKGLSFYDKKIIDSIPDSKCTYKELILKSAIENLMSNLEE